MNNNISQIKKVLSDNGLSHLVVGGPSSTQVRLDKSGPKVLPTKGNGVFLRKLNNGDVTYAVPFFKVLGKPVQWVPVIVGRELRTGDKGIESICPQIMSKLAPKLHGYDAALTGAALKPNGNQLLLVAEHSQHLNFTPAWQMKANIGETVEQSFAQDSPFAGLGQIQIRKDKIQVFTGGQSEPLFTVHVPPKGGEFVVKIAGEDNTYNSVEALMFGIAASHHHMQMYPQMSEDVLRHRINYMTEAIAPVLDMWGEKAPTGNDLELLQEAALEHILVVKTEEDDVDI